MSPNDPSTGAPDTGPLALYAKHQKIYPRNITGTFRSLKWMASAVLLGLYFLAPCIRWDRGPGVADQAILLDIPGRRLYFFTIEIWPQEIYFLAGILIFSAIGLFFVTALAGRVWCGFTCPQTVWTDIFVWIERRIEGERNARLKLDRGPWTLHKLGRKVVKHALWMAIAAATGLAFVSYFSDAFILVREVATARATATEYGFIALFAGTTYLFAGLAREQVCIYMCPWPRFQGTMFDEHSLIVTYEEWRGEPRAKAKPGGSFEGRGDCVDCRLCVQVCPTGVDIRQGSQMACIGCALCVDACNSVMARFGRPGGLIAYDSEANQVARSRREPTRIRLIRPRTIAYALVLGVVAAVMAGAMSVRSRMEIHVLGDRSPLFVELSDRSIRNGYTYKVLNMERKSKTFTLSLGGISGATLHVIGHGTDGSNSVRLPVQPDDVSTFRVFVKAPPTALQGKSTPLTFVLTDEATGQAHPHVAAFAGPEK